MSSSAGAPTNAVGATMVRAALESQDSLAKAGLGKAEQLKGKPVWAFDNASILKAAKQA